MTEENAMGKDFTERLDSHGFTASRIYQKPLSCTFKEVTLWCIYYTSA